jgi:hypothetical protein
LRWWDLFFLGFALVALANIRKWRGEVDKDKRRGNELLAEANRDVLWEEARALLIVLGVWAATFAYRIFS